MESSLVPYASSALSNLLGQQATSAAKAAVPSLTKILVNQAPSVPQLIPVTKPKMQTIYRGISAKNDDDLAQYIRDMVNKNIQPATYGGGNMQGEGYNFSTGKDTAEYFATRNPIKESRAILKTEVPMDRFVQQNEQNQNRLQDFVRRAEARGIPYENGESERQGLADMQKYFKKNGILGIRSNSGETYVINNNDDAWMKNLEVLDAMRGRRTRIEPDSNLLASLSDTMDIYNSAKRDLAPEVTKYLPDKATARYYLDDQNMGTVDLSGKPVVGQKVDLTNLPDSQYPVRRSQIPQGVDQTTGMGHVDLAKTGTQSILSPEQEAFFKDSVIRDKSGNLIPMYHGTKGDFTVFGASAPSSSSNSHSGVGYWFTPNEQGAKNFANSIWYGEGEPKVMRTYLNVKNPKIYETVDNSEAVDLLRKKLSELELKIKVSPKPKLYYKNMYDYSVAYNMINQGNKDMAIKWLAGKSGYDDKTATDFIEEIDNLKKLVDERNKIQNEISELKYGDAYERFRTDIYKEDGQTAEDANVGGTGMILNDDNSIKRYVDKLRAEGYDGIIIRGTRYDSDVMGGVNDQYVVFDPEQIKNIDNLNPTDNPDIRYSLGSSNTSSAASSTGDITRIGSSDVSPVDPETLPDSLRAAQEYLDEGKFIKEMEKFTGKPYAEITDQDFIDYSLSFRKPEERDIFRSIIEDLVAGGSNYKKIARSYMQNGILNKMLDSHFTDIEPKALVQYLNNHKTALSNNAIKDIDKELSDRLGIGRSNTFMRDDNVPSDALGAYNPMDTSISMLTNQPKEQAISTLGHERLHSFQTENDLKRYDKRVTDAYEELARELDKHLKTPDEIAKKYDSDVEYWANEREQQSRMLQQYLENKGFTKGGVEEARSGEWGNEINSAFDKFFKKLRELSKKGIALPSLALLFGGAAVASKEKEKK